MTVSGKEDPDMEPAIEMTHWGLGFLSGYTNAMATAPKDFCDRLISFRHDRQDPTTGLYIDKQGPANSRETARNQASALGTMKYFNVETKYPHPRNTASASTNAPVLPEYMGSVESYMNFVKSFNWDHGSWTAGDQTQSSLQYVNMLPEEKRAEYKDALFTWLGERQQESGLWSPDFDFNAASGAFKVGLVYATYGMRLPNPDKIVDAIFECYRVSKTTSPFFVRNPISVLRQMSLYSDELREKIRAGIIENIDAVTASFGEFLCPDGAFSARKEKSMLAFGGVVGSHELFEGDIDATMMMLIARRELYLIYGEDAPKLNTDNFWDWIYGKKPMPKLNKAQ